MNQSYLEQFYQDILCKQDISKFEKYFLPDCQITLNNKFFNADDFKARMQWIKNNFKQVKVKVVDFIISADGKSFSDTHISETVDNNNKLSKVILMQHSTLIDGKINRFSHVGYLYEGDLADGYIINAK